MQSHVGLHNQARGVANVVAGAVFSLLLQLLFELQHFSLNFLVSFLHFGKLHPLARRIRHELLQALVREGILTFSSSKFARICCCCTCACSRAAATRSFAFSVSR